MSDRLESILAWNGLALRYGIESGVDISKLLAADVSISTGLKVSAFTVMPTELETKPLLFGLRACTNVVPGDTPITVVSCIVTEGVVELILSKSSTLTLTPSSCGLRLNVAIASTTVSW